MRLLGAIRVALMPNTRSMNGVEYQRRFINPDASLFCETDVQFGLSQTIGVIIAIDEFVQAVVPDR